MKPAKCTANPALEIKKAHATHASGCLELLQSTGCTAEESKTLIEKRGCAHQGWIDSRWHRLPMFVVITWPPICRQEIMGSVPSNL